MVAGVRFPENSGERFVGWQDTLRKKKTKNEGEVEAWIGKYDVDMEDKEKEITGLRAVYEEVRITSHPKIP